jgi:hypothetical protein
MIFPPINLWSAPYQRFLHRKLGAVGYDVDDGDDKMNRIGDGNKFDDDKLDYALIPFRALDEVVKVLMFGAKKYDEDNWKYVDNAKRRYLSACYRHVNALVDGEWLDKESGLPHAAHAVCCLLFVLWFGDGE